jgi:bifunctional DNA-binding transcriptional regulator/antitoxin component of YhaV-PrlF toxin-antitoxin module
MLRVIRPLHNGKLVIPDEFQRELGIGEDSTLQLTVENGELRIRAVQEIPADQVPAWVKKAYDALAPLREEVIEAGYTEEEINGTIDEAIAAVRRQDG